MDKKNIKENILCIGLPKSGTSSMYAALNRLGYKSIHYINGTGEHLDLDKKIVDYIRSVHPQPYESFDRFYDMNYDKSIIDLALKNHNALTDIPWSYMFKFIHKNYNNFKYILNYRNEKDYLDTFDRFRKYRKKNNIPYGIQYTDKEFHEKNKKDYRNHNNIINNFFKNENILRFEIGKDGYKELCNFLNLDIIDEPFPHRYKQGELIPRNEKYKFLQ